MQKKTRKFKFSQIFFFVALMTTQPLEEGALLPEVDKISSNIDTGSDLNVPAVVLEGDISVEQSVGIDTLNKNESGLQTNEKVDAIPSKPTVEEPVQNARRDGRTHQPRHPPCPILFLPNMSSNAFEKDLAEFALLLPAPVIRTFMYMSDAAHHGFVESATVDEGTQNLEYINSHDMEVKGKKIVAEYSRRRTVEDRRTYEQRQHRRKATDDHPAPRERRRSRSPPSRGYPTRREYERYPQREERYESRHDRYPQERHPSRGYPPREDRYPSRDERYPPRDYAPGPPRDYVLPPREYAPPPREYAPPSHEYAPPSRDYDPPPRDYHPAPRDYPHAPREYAPPSREYPPAHREYAPREYGSADQYQRPYDPHYPAEPGYQRQEHPIGYPSSRPTYPEESRPGHPLLSLSTAARPVGTGYPPYK